MKEVRRHSEVTGEEQTKIRGTAMRRNTVMRRPIIIGAVATLAVLALTIYTLLPSGSPSGTGAKAAEVKQHQATPALSLVEAEVTNTNVAVKSVPLAKPQMMTHAAIVPAASEKATLDPLTKRRIMTALYLAELDGINNFPEPWKMTDADAVIVPAASERAAVDPLTKRRVMTALYLAELDGINDFPAPRE